MTIYHDAQRSLKAKGLYGGGIDGIWGQGSRNAINTFKRKNHLPEDGLLDPKTAGLLGLQPPKLMMPPWTANLYAKKGLRESGSTKDELVAYLKSDGHYLGDPAKFPWCGEAMETSILLTGFGPTPSNPYLARAWLTYGKGVKPGYGGIAIFKRPGPNGNEGHVGHLVGISKDAKRFRVLGGNQQNMITDDSWVAVDRLLGCRVPTAYNAQLSQLPTLSDEGTFLSKDEA